MTGVQTCALPISEGEKEAGGVVGAYGVSQWSDVWDVLEAVMFDLFHI